MFTESLEFTVAWAKGSTWIVPLNPPTDHGRVWFSGHFIWEQGAGGCVRGGSVLSVPIQVHTHFVREITI